MACSGVVEALPFVSFFLSLFHLASCGSKIVGADNDAMWCDVGPEVEKRIADFQRANGQVLFGGHLRSEMDPNFAMPDDIGLSLPDAYPLVGSGRQ